MKIYVAGKFEQKDLIREICRKLEEIGYEISYDWTTHKPIKPYYENQEIAREYSQKEFDGISNSDIFIYLSSEKGTTLNIEFGAAIMLAKTKGKPIIYVVGEFNDKSPWFFDPFVKRKKSVEEVIEELKNFTH